MPIRFLDHDTRLGRVRATLADATSVFSGTSVQQFVSGVINAQTVLSGAFSGTFRGAQNHIGTISAQLANYTSGFTGTFAAAVAASAPFLVGLDIPAAPTSGGENNLGMYVTLYGFNLGSLSDYGTTKKVLVNNVEVANYRYVAGCAGSGVSGFGNGVFETWGLQALSFQIGAIGSPSAGTLCPVDITDGSGISITRNQKSAGKCVDLEGNNITFMAQPGPIVFVNEATGSDAAAGTKAAPLQHLQVYNSSTGVFTGAIYGPTATGTPTTTNQVVPGTMVVLRGGTYTGTSFQSRWVNYFRKTGVAPNGTANHGYIHVTSYPGDAGANTPELAFFNGPSGSAGIQMADSARSGEATPWGTTGHCKYLSFSRLKIACPANAPADGAPVNCQTAADFCRVTNCEIGPWPSNIEALAGGIAGFGHSRFICANYIHGIQSSTGLENHGIYIGSNISNGTVVGFQGELHSVYSFNVIKDCTGGNGIMQRGAVVAETAPYTAIHHNWLENFGKYGILQFDSRNRGNIYQNVIVGGANGQAGYQCNSDNVTTTDGIIFAYNTLIGWKTYAAVYCLGASAAGSVRIESNVMHQIAANTAASFGYVVSNNGQTLTLTKNIYYSDSGSSNEAAKPAGDTLGSRVNPLFANLAANDFRPGASSPLVNAGTVPHYAFTALDFLALQRPQGTNTNYSIGAFERAGG